MKPTYDITYMCTHTPPPTLFSVTPKKSCLLHSVWKSSKNVSFEFFTNFCPTKIDLSDNNASFNFFSQKLAKLNATFLWFSNNVSKTAANGKVTRISILFCKVAHVWALTSIFSSKEILIICKVWGQIKRLIFVMNPKDESSEWKHSRCKCNTWVDTIISVQKLYMNSGL